MQPDILFLSYHQQHAIDTWFSRVQHLPWAMLLSSGHAKHGDSRFDIMTADPRVTLETRGDCTRVTESKQTCSRDDDPLSLVDAYLDTLPVAENNTPYPFVGGALGLFGYDLARNFETLPSQARQELTTPDMAVGIYDWALIADHATQQLVLVSLNNAQARLDWLLSHTRETELAFHLTSDWESNMTRQQYQQAFARIQQYILAGDCYQINLGQRFRAGYQGSEWLAYQQLSAHNQAPFSAFIRLQDSALLCLSPERFLKVERQRIETRPIKGTLPRLSDPGQDRLQAQKLANSLKDRAENLMIVDLLRNDISRVAVPGSVTVPQLFVTEAFPSVHHLVSTIHGVLPEQTSNTQLLRACFPGGSITGAPKIRAMEIIDELEPVRRNAWCGSIGYLSGCGRMDTNITIRTLIAENQQLYCTSGGGIVADSQAEAEYQETLDKISKILPVLRRMNRSD